MNTLSAYVVSGEGIVSALIWLVCMGLVFWLLFWLITYVALPEPFAKVAKVILAVAAVVFLINILMGLAGHPLIIW